MFSAEAPSYVLPEVVVQKIDDEYVVILNNDQIPHLRISKHYRQLMADAGHDAGRASSYIRDKIRAGAVPDQEHSPAPADHLQHRHARS